MKTNKVCPKCNGTDIIKIPGYTGPYGVGNNIPTGFTYSKVDRYVCLACSYSEEWIDSDDMKKIIKKYKK